MTVRILQPVKGHAVRIPDVRVRKGQRARIAAFRRALRQGLVDDRRIVHVADAELQAAQLVRRALGIRHREVEADAALAHGQVVFKAFGRERVAQLAVRIAQGQRADLQAVTINGHFPVPGQAFHIGHRQGRARRIRTQAAKGHAVRIPDVRVRKGQRARIAAFRRALRLGLVDDRRIVPIADAELQAAQLVRRALGIRHREVEADAALAHGQVVFKAFGRERVAQLAVRIAQGQRADLQAVTINGHFPVPGQAFHIGHRQGRARRIRTQAAKGHAVRIPDVRVRKGQRARIAAFRRALRQGLVDDRRIVPIADAELQAVRRVRTIMRIRHRDAEVDVL